MRVVNGRLASSKSARDYFFENHLVIFQSDIRVQGIDRRIFKIVKIKMTTPINNNKHLSKSRFYDMTVVDRKHLPFHSVHVKQLLSTS
jgi:hypothetical protein